jgi:hypothetical protein
MRTVRYAATAIVLGVACVARAGADPASSSSTTVTASGGTSTAPAQSGTQKTDLSQTLFLPDADNHLEIQPATSTPNLQTALGAEADATLSNVGDLPPVRPATPQLTQGEIEASIQRQAEEEKSKDWLLRGYEQQLQSRLGKTSEDQSTNLYYQLASDKDLAKLAGISTIEFSPAAAVTAPRTGASDSDKDAPALRKDPSEESKKSGMTDFMVFKPMINPERPVFTSTWNNPYTSLSYGASRVVTPDAVTTTTDSTEKTSDVNVPSDIEMPGLVAAKSDPLSLGLAADVSDGFSQQEPLPQDPSVLDVPPSLPAYTASAMLQKNYDAALNVPGSVKLAQPPPQLLNPVVYKMPDNSEPIVKVAQPNPVRRALPSPLDIPY